MTLSLSLFVTQHLLHSTYMPSLTISWYKLLAYCLQMFISVLFHFVYNVHYRNRQEFYLKSSLWWFLGLLRGLEIFQPPGISYSPKFYFHLVKFILHLSFLHTDFILMFCMRLNLFRFLNNSIHRWGRLF